MKHKDVDMVLKNALRSTERPAPALVKNVKVQVEEAYTMNTRRTRRSFGTIAVTAVALLLITTTALAAGYFLKPAEVAEKIEDHALRAAFESETAVNINASVTSGDYIVTLLAVVTGSDITDMPYYSEEVQDERTYAVVAIQNADGTPMPDTSDDDYGETSFFASPLVKGLAPWQVNAARMNGGYTEIVADGIVYRIVECDDVAVFANRGLYFAVCSGVFYDADAFIYDERTGEITVNPEYEGVNAIFDLPIDPSFADPERAAQYLDGLDSVQ